MQYCGDSAKYGRYKEFADAYNSGKDIGAMLSSKKLFVLDMDGTFYLGGKLFSGSQAFINSVVASGKDFLFFTNNSSRSAVHYSEKLRGMGFDIPAGKIMTSGDVTMDYLNKAFPGKRIYLMGTPSLTQNFIKGGLNIVQDDPDVVVLGFDTSMTYEKIAKACDFITGGAVFLATHPDVNCPVENGFVPDCGAMCAMIKASTGIGPQFLGKPSRHTVDAIIGRTGLSKDDIVFAGDRLYTDIAIGSIHGATTILVLSGETVPGDIEKSPFRPDVVVPLLSDLIPHFIAAGTVNNI